MSEGKKIILVFGATGRQGSSVINHLLNNSDFKLRAFVRNLHQHECMELEKKGVELFLGDLCDKKTILKALSGVYGVYGVTDFWDCPKEPEKEVTCGKNLCDAISETKTIEHFIFSTLPCSKEHLKIDSPPFCNKAEISHYAKSLKLPMTEICLSFYYENFMRRLKPKIDKDGTTIFYHPLGDKKLPMCPACCIGKVISEIFDKKDEYIGKCFALVGDELSGNEIAEIYSKVTNSKAKYEPMKLEEFKNSGIEGSEISYNAFTIYQSLPDIFDLKACQKNFPEKLESFQEWLEESKFKVTS